MCGCRPLGQPLPDTTYRELYSATAGTASDGTPPSTWDASGLPFDLAIADGIVSGDPQASGNFPYTITVRDSDGVEQTCSGTLVVERQIVPVGQNIQTFPNPSGTSGEMDHGDVLQYSYEGAVDPSVIFPGWDRASTRTVHVRFAAGNAFNKDDRPTRISSTCSRHPTRSAR